MAVLQNRKYEQGYPLTTSYAAYGNLTDRGYPSSTSGYTPTAQNLTAQGYPDSKSGIGSAGLTGSKLGSYSYTAPTTTSTGGSARRKTSTAKSTAKSTATTTPAVSTTNNYTDNSRQYGGDYDILTGEYTGGSPNSFDAAGAYQKLLEAYKNNNGYANYLDEMNAAAQAAYDRGLAAINDAYNSQMTTNAAQDAYDRGMSALNDAYNKQMELLGGSYNTQRSTLEDNLNRAKTAMQNTYNTSRNNLASDAESSLKQAYINNMLSRRNIGQQLSALGMNGGLTETTLAGLANNYGNQRNNINTTLNRNLADIESKYNNNLSELEGNYGSELANALQAYNNALANASSQKSQQLIDLENTLASNKLQEVAEANAQARQRAQMLLDLENTLANNRMNAYSNYSNMQQKYNSDYYDLIRSAIANNINLSY